MKDADYKIYAKNRDYIITRLVDQVHAGKPLCLLAPFHIARNATFSKDPKLCRHYGKIIFKDINAGSDEPNNFKPFCQSCGTWV